MENDVIGLIGVVLGALLSVGRELPDPFDIGTGIQ